MWPNQSAIGSLQCCALLCVLLLLIGYSSSVHFASHNPNYKIIISETISSRSAPHYGEEIPVPDYPPPKQEQDKTCILGTNAHYLNWWLSQEGQLIVADESDGDTFLDLSGRVQTADTIADEIRQRFPHRLPFINRTNMQPVHQLLALSVAYAGLTAVPESALRLANHSLQLLSLRGNDFYASRLAGDRNNAEEHSNNATAMDTQLQPWDTFPPMPRLRELDLTNCSITTIGASTFVQMPSLQRLYLGFNCLKKLSPFSFAWLPNLFHLDMSRNCQSQSARQMRLDVEQVDDPDACLLQLHVDTFANAPSLVFIDLSYTELHSRSARCLGNMPANLELLSLCYTELPMLLAHTFSASRLQVLDLSGNIALPMLLQYDSLRGLGDTLDILAADESNLRSIMYFCTLKKLRTLLLAGNNINELYAEAFRGLDALELLDLSENHLGNWYVQAFAGVTPQLRILKLQKNNINLITTAMFTDFEQLHYLALSGNNFICNCALRDFMDVAARNSRLRIDCPVLHPERSLGFGPQVSDGVRRAVVVDAGGRQLLVRNVMPPHVLRIKTLEAYDLQRRMRQIHLRQLTESVFNMSLVKQQQPQYNVMMMMRSGEGAGAGGAGHGNNNVPARIRSMALRPIAPARKLIDNVIRNFTYQLLDFDDGSYKCINTTTTRSYRLDMIANCSAQERRLDADDEYEDLVPLVDSPRYIVAAVLGSVAVAVPGFLLLYYYWWYIRFVWMTLRNSAILSSLRREKNQRLIQDNASDDGSAAGTFTYDVFVSYCESNRDWILGEFLPNMDQCSDIKVCLHERDFQVGLSILENIIHCMDASRYLLLVVSQSFLLSQWCQFEMHLAQHRLLETRREQLILILLEDIPRRKRPQTLHYLMRTKTYIKWPAGNDGQPDAATTTNAPPLPQRVQLERRQFWRRLKRVLAHSDWEEEERVTKQEVVAADVKRRSSAHVVHV